MKVGSKIKYGIFLLILFCIVYFIIYYFSSLDVNNVKVKGYVYDLNTCQPLDNVQVIINSDRYEDDKGNTNYDEYFGHDKIEIYTNEKGFYSTTIKKSSFLWINFQKEGYSMNEEKGMYSSKNMDYETYLKRID